VTSAVVGVGARVLSAARAAASDVREMLTLPSPGEATAALTEAQDVALDGLSTFVTPNDEFYRIDTALQVPAVDAASWTLRIVGMVEEEVEIGFDELLALPLVERYITLACVSQEVGGGLIGNARWLGFPIRELLARARPTADADMVLSRSVDGFTASTPLEVLQDPATDSLLAVGMNGEPLPLDHGFPVRMVVPGLYGYVSATKWVTELRVTTFADDLAYWSTRGWTERGPVKLSSRIDTPPDRRRIEPGPTKIAGVAWAQHTGVSAVEVRIDDGRWQQASLADEVSVDAWLQWWFDWDAASGSHTIEVRATDADGLVQTADLAPPAPDGSTGHHTITVRVD
jgi:DMSO/TMAO reductase YedYZ molybdopterin-dependent catalytic subunit